MTEIRLKAGRDRSVLHRHPWIFSGAVDSVSGEALPGSVVRVCDAKGAPLGLGAYSPASTLRIRMISFGESTTWDETTLARRIAEAIGRRAMFFVDGRTDAFRLVHAESDGLPGVTVDYYAGWIVVQLTTVFADVHKDAIAAALMSSVPGARGVYNRSDVDIRAREGLPLATGLLAGEEPPEVIEIHEGGVRYLVDVRRGHKTGFYLDQREARAQVSAFANGREMLNCFCYTGGFGLAARPAGVARVTQLDISEEALALARRNEGLDHLCGTTFDYVLADVFKQLRLYRDQGRTFDMIVLDPPKFAETKGQLMRAARGYKDINLLAMKLLRPDGILATFSCSGAMTTDLFDKVVAEAALDAKADFQVLTRTRQATDHPVSLAFPEGFYLKGLILRRQ